MKKVLACAKSLKEARRITEAMVTRYTCDFLILGNNSLPRKLQWPVHTRGKYNRIINELYELYVINTKCSWKSYKEPDDLSLQQCIPCKKALDECINDREWASLKLTWCEMSQADAKSLFEETRNNFACTIQALSKHMPEGKRVLKQQFSKADRKINDQEQCVDVDKAVEKLSKTRGRGN